MGPYQPAVGACGRDRDHEAWISDHALGRRPRFGRGFTPEARWSSDAVDEVVLSHAAWRRLFGGRQDVLGATVELVVSLTPTRFEWSVSCRRRSRSRSRWTSGPRGSSGRRNSNRVRNWRYDRMIARLRPEATLDSARAELETVAARLARAYPASNRGWTVTIEPLRDSIVGGFGRATWLLLAAVAVVLVMTSLNVGGLLASRGMARDRETAVRAALGAGSWRLRRLWLAEASVLTVIGTAAGLLLAWTGVSALVAAAPPGIPRLDAIAIDLPTFGVAAASAVLAVAIFTMGSLRRPSGSALADRLRGSSGTAAARQTTRTAVLVVQCGGAATLVVLAMLLTRSLVRLTAVDLGWEAGGVLSLSVLPPAVPGLRIPWSRNVDWSDRMIARLEATPGIERAAISTAVPLSGASFPSTLARGRGQPSTDPGRWPAVQQNVTDGYFGLMGIRLLAGRRFGPEDRFTEAQLTLKERPDRGVAIVSAATARALWPGRSAIGESIWLPDADLISWREVVGVVEDFQFHAVGEVPVLHVFVPRTQLSTGRPHLLVKGTGEPAAITATVRAVVEEVEPGTFVDRVMPLEALVSRATAQPRFTSRVVAAFGGLALLLAAVGIHGTLSLLVAARTREIGVRLSLGAPRREVVASVIRRGLMPAVGGGALGLAVAAVLARGFRALLFEIEPLDVGSFAAGAAVLLVVTLVATLGPARRVSRIDPARALRTE